MQTACSILKKNGFAVITAPPGALITALKPLKVDGAGELPAIKKAKPNVWSPFIPKKLALFGGLRQHVFHLLLLHLFIYSFYIANVGVPKEAQSAQHGRSQTTLSEAPRRAQ